MYKKMARLEKPCAHPNFTGGGSPQKPIAGATAEATAGRLPAGSRNAACQAKGFDLPHTRTHPDSMLSKYPS